MKTIQGLVLGFVVAIAGTAHAAEYKIDTQGAHAFINAKYMHLGYSVLHATFRSFDGSFSWDPENVEASTVNVTIDVTSLDSNHKKRDEHMTDEEYLNSAANPTASFVSTRVEDKGEGKMVIHGDLTLNGVTKNIAIDTRVIGEGSDPWGGYRAGFEGFVTLNPDDFNMPGFRGGAIDMELFLEGIRQ